MGERPLRTVTADILAGRHGGNGRVGAGSYGSNQTRLGVDPSVVQGHRMSKMKFSLSSTSYNRSVVSYGLIYEPECPMEKYSKVGVRQQRTITLDVQ